MNKHEVIDKVASILRDALGEALQELADEQEQVLPPEVAEFWEVTTERSEWMWFGPENQNKRGKNVLVPSKRRAYHAGILWVHCPNLDQHCVRLKQKYRDAIAEYEKQHKCKVEVVDWRKPVRGVAESWMTTPGVILRDNTAAFEGSYARPILKITPIERQWETVEYLYGGEGRGVNLSISQFASKHVAEKCTVARRLVHPDGTMMVIEPGQVVEVQDEKEGE